MQFFSRCIGWAEVLNFAFRFLIVFPFFEEVGEGVRKDRNVFVGIFGVTSKIENFMD